VRIQLDIYDFITFYISFRDYPTIVMNKLLRKLECLEYEAVPYDVFKSGVFTCYVLEGKDNVCV
jgi:hypothetical protein